MTVETDQNPIPNWKIDLKIESLLEVISEDQKNLWRMHYADKLDKYTLSNTIIESVRYKKGKEECI